MKIETPLREREGPNPSAGKVRVPSVGMPQPHAWLAAQRSLGNRTVQRLLSQRQAGDGFELDDATAGRIESARSGGQPLDAALQQGMSSVFEHDFGSVRVHESRESDALSRELGATAFTTGQDIFFRRGTYAPSSTSGRELLAHELTHVAQQGSGRVASPGGRMAVTSASDPLEQEAESASQIAVRELARMGAQPPSQSDSNAVNSEGAQLQRQLVEDEEIG